jgi:hypothetical protein
VNSFCSSKHKIDIRFCHFIMHAPLQQLGMGKQMAFTAAAAPLNTIAVAAAPALSCAQQWFSMQLFVPGEHPGRAACCFQHMQPFMLKSLRCNFLSI